MSVGAGAGRPRKGLAALALARALTCGAADDKAKSRRRKSCGGSGAQQPGDAIVGSRIVNGNRTGEDCRE